MITLIFDNSVIPTAHTISSLLKAADSYLDLQSSGSDLEIRLNELEIEPVLLRLLRHVREERLHASDLVIIDLENITHHATLDGDITPPFTASTHEFFSWRANELF